MTAFRIRVKKRLRLMLVANGMIIGAIGIALHYSNAQVAVLGPSWMLGFVKGLQIGAFLGLQTLLLWQILKTSTTLRSEEALKAQYVYEHDERRALIYAKMGGHPINWTLGGLATAAIIAAFFDATIFFTLLGALLFTALIKGAHKIYYLNHY